ncbi:hypothetical protein MRX96_013330 [Rhipicephalus microplus]
MAHFRVRLLRLALPSGNEARAGPGRDATGPGRGKGPGLCSTRAAPLDDKTRVRRAGYISGSVVAHLRTEAGLVALFLPTRCGEQSRVHHGVHQTGASLYASPCSLLDTVVYSGTPRVWPSGWLLFDGTLAKQQFPRAWAHAFVEEHASTAALPPALLNPACLWHLCQFCNAQTGSVELCVRALLSAIRASHPALLLSFRLRRTERAGRAQTKYSGPKVTHARRASSMLLQRGCISSAPLAVYNAAVEEDRQEGRACATSRARRAVMRNGGCAPPALRLSAVLRARSDPCVEWAVNIKTTKVKDFRALGSLYITPYRLPFSYHHCREEDTNIGDHPVIDGPLANILFRVVFERRSS